MANTIEQVEAHALFNTVERLTEQTGELQGHADALPEGMLERITALAGLLSSRIESSDSIMIPTVVLDQTQNHLNNVVGELQNYLSNENSQHVQNAINKIGSAFQSFPSVFRIEGEGTYNKILTALSKRAQNHIGKLNTHSEATLTKLNQLESDLSRLKDSIVAEQERIIDGLGNVETQFTEAQGSRTKAFNEALDGYSASLREGLKDSKSTLDNHIKTSKVKFAKDTQTTRSELDAMNSDSRKKHNEIRRLYGLVGRDSQIGGYKENAERARKAGVIWDVVTFSFMILAILVLVGPSLVSYFTAGFSPIDWIQVLSRFPISTVLLIPAAYAGTQSRRQKKSYDTAKRNQLHIAALGPYLSTLPKNAQDQIRTLLAPRFFDSESSEPLDLQALLRSGNSSNFAEDETDDPQSTDG